MDIQNILEKNKKENELDTNDRIELLMQSMEEHSSLEIYEKILDKKNFIIDKTVKINDYVFNDVEFLQDHYLNVEKGIFKKLNKCKTKMGSIIFKKILLNPIDDIEILKKRQKMYKNISIIKTKINPLLDEIKLLENNLTWVWDNASMEHIDFM